MEMSKVHEKILDVLIDKIQDDLDDSYKSYHSAMELSLYNNPEMVSFCIEDAKTRLKHSDMLKEKVAYIVRQLDTHGDVFKRSYIKTLEAIEDLKIKVTNFSY